MKIGNMSKYKTIVKFENGIEIKADQMNWVLYIPSPRTYWYYPTLDGVFTDLLNLRIKEISAKDSRKTIQCLTEAIIQAKTEIRVIIDTLTTVKIPEQSRLDMQEGRLRIKDD